MDLERLKSEWQAQGMLEGSAPATETKPLLERLAQLEQDVQRRDVREYLAACVVMAIFGWRAATTDDLLVRIGSLVVVFGAMFIIVWSRRAYGATRSRAFTGDLPMTQFLARELDRVEAQVRLLKSAWWWYVAPTVVGILITLISGARAVWTRMAAAAVVVTVGVLIAWLNQVTARQELEPLRDDLRQYMAELDAP